MKAKDRTSLLEERVTSCFSETSLPFGEGQFFIGWNYPAYYGVVSILDPCALKVTVTTKTTFPDAS